MQLHHPCHQNRIQHHQIAQLHLNELGSTHLKDQHLVQLATPSLITTSFTQSTFASKNSLRSSTPLTMTEPDRLLLELGYNTHCLMAVSKAGQSGHGQLSNTSLESHDVFWHSYVLVKGFSSSFGLVFQ